MNLSNLSHPVVQARIYAAMRMAVNAANGVYDHCQKGKFQITPGGKRGTVYIQNKKGHNFLRVTYQKATQQNGSGFSFYAGGGECTDVVIQSLRMG